MNILLFKRMHKDVKMVQPLIPLTAYQEDSGYIMSDSQLPVTPAPGDPMPLASAGTELL